MFAVVAGNGLGLSNTSTSNLSKPEVWNDPTQGSKQERIHVNIANGNLILNSRDEFLVSSGIDLALTRTYNSQGGLNDGVGAQWRLGLRKQIVLQGALNSAGSTLTRTDGDGATSVYVWEAARAAYISTDGDGPYKSIVREGANWVWRNSRNDKLGSHEIYDATNGGRIIAWNEGSAGGLTYEYAADGKLAKVVDASGDQTTFTFQNGNLTEVNTNAAAGGNSVRIAYSYDMSNRLLSVTVDLTPQNANDDRLFVTRYTYDGASQRIASVTQDDGPTTSFSYTLSGGAWKIATVSENETQVAIFDYSVADTTTVIDRAGLKTTYKYDALKQLTEVITPISGGTAGKITYTYDAKGNIVSVSEPSGLVRIAQYDANGNQVVSEDNSGQKITRTFDPVSNALLTESVVKGSASFLNGSFDAGTAGWRTEGTATASTVNGTLKAVVPSGTAGYIYQQFTGLEVGKRYMLSFLAKTDNSATAVWMGSTQGASNLGTVNIPSGVLQGHSMSFIANSSTAFIGVMGGASGAQFDDITLTLQTSPNLIPGGDNMESVAGWGIPPGATFTKTAEGAVFKPSDIEGATMRFSGLEVGAKYSFTISGKVLEGATQGTRVYVGTSKRATDYGFITITQADGTRTVDFVATSTVATISIGDDDSTRNNTLIRKVSLSRSASVAGQPELLANPDFVDGLTGWSVSGRLRPYAAEGTARLYATAAKSTSILSQTIDTVPGRQYLIRMNFSLIDPTTSPSLRIAGVSTGQRASFSLDGPYQQYFSFFANDSKTTITVSQSCASDATETAASILDQISVRELVSVNESYAPLAPTIKAVTRQIYDIRQQLRFRIAGDGSVIEYRYDGKGQLLTEINYGAGNRYNCSGLADSQRPSEAQMAAWAASNAIDQLQLTTKSYTYDSRSLLASASIKRKVVSSGVSSDVVETSTFVYSQSGLLLSRIEGGKTTTYTYDESDRIASSTDRATDGSTLTRIYDESGKQVISYQTSPAVQPPATAPTVPSAAGHPQFVTLPQVPTPAGLKLSMSAFTASFNGKAVEVPAYTQELPANSVIDIWADASGTLSVVSAVPGYDSMPRFDDKLHVARLLSHATGISAATLRGDMSLLSGKIESEAFDKTTFLKDIVIPMPTAQWTAGGNAAAGAVLQTAGGQLYRVLTAGITGASAPTGTGKRNDGTAVVEFVGHGQFAGAWKSFPNGGIDWHAGNLAAGRLAGIMPNEVKNYLQAAIKGLVRDWAPGRRVEAGMRVAGPATKGMVWECVTAGTTGTAAFSVAATIGATVTESNGVVWRAVAAHQGNASWLLSDTSADLRTAVAPAAHGAYAATLVWAVQQYVAASGDTAWLGNASVHQGFSNAAVLKEVLSANLLTQFDNGLVKTFQGDQHPDGGVSTTRTLAGNAETWAGLKAGADLFARLGDASLSSQLAAQATANLAGIESLWQADAGAYRHAKGADMTAASAALQFEQAVASQYWLAQFGVPVEAARLQAAAAYADNRRPSWHLRTDTGETTNLGAHYGRYLLGKRTDLADVLDGVRTRHLRRVPAGELAPAAFSVADAAMYLVLGNLPGALHQPKASALGFANGSASVLNQATLFGYASVRPAQEAAFVNTATGNLVLHNQDEHIVAAGVDISINRTYNSLGGGKWLIGPTKSLQVVGPANSEYSYVVRTVEDGSSQVYSYVPELHLYRSSDGSGAHDNLAWDNGTQQWTWMGERRDARALHERYNAAGQLVAVDDQFGDPATFEYLASGALSRVRHASGDVTLFDYHGDKLGSVRTAFADGRTQVRAQYAYDEHGRLTQTTVDMTPDIAGTVDQQVHTTSYTYHGTSQQIKNVTRSDGSKLAFTYGVDGKVASMADALGRTVAFKYTMPGQTTVVDTAGNETHYQHDTAGNLAAVIAPVVNGSAAVKRFHYDGQGNLLKSTSPAGMETVFEYDANGNCILERDASGNTVSRLYDPMTNLLLREVRFAMPDPDGARAAQASEPMASYFAYDGNGRLRFSVSPEGRLTEHRYENDGPARSQLVYDGSTFPVPTVPGLLALSDFEAWLSQGGANLSRVMRSDFTYDGRGQLAKTTSFNATDTQGNGAGTQTVVEHTRDAAGQLIQTIVRNGGSDRTTTFTYDRLGRLLSEVDHTGLEKKISYDLAGGSSVISDVNGVSTRYEYNAAGQVLSVTATHDGLTTVTRNYYDAAGRLRMVRDPQGLLTHFLYDTMGRKAATIVGEALTEYIYDVNSMPVRSVTYAADLRISPVDNKGEPADVNLAALRPVASISDRRSWSSYDAAGRLVARVDASGYLTRTQYDGAGRPVRTIARANPISLSVLVDDMIPATIYGESSEADRIERIFYDRDGKQVGVLAADGALTEYRYSGAGLLEESIVYLERTRNELRATGTLDQLRPAGGGQASSRNFHDGKGQLIATLDADAYLTELAYDSVGNVVRRTRYARQVANPRGATLHALDKKLSSEDRATSYEYNALNQLIRERSLAGEIAYTYDRAGNVVSVTHSATAEPDRNSVRRYTQFGQLAAELNGEGAARLKALGANPTEAEIAQLFKSYGVSYTFDHAGNRTSVTDAMGRATYYLYDKGRLTATINPAGEVEERRYNKFGDLVLVKQHGRSLDAQEVAAVVAAGTLGVVSLSGTARVAKYYYDADGRLAYSVAPDGAVQQRRYNGFGQVVQTISYKDRLASVGTSVVDEGIAGGIPNELQPVVSSPAGGQRITSFYDTRGRLNYLVNDEGEVEGRSYNAQGYLAAITHYGQRIASAGLSGAANESGAFRSLSAQGAQEFEYNARGLMTVSRDAMQGVKQFGYNAFGEKTSAVRILNAATRGDGDAVSQTLYDNAGRVRATVDATGLVTSFTYNGAGQVTEEVRHGQSVAPDIEAAILTEKLGNGALSAPQEDARRRFVYDNDGNLVASLVMSNASEAASQWTVQSHRYDKDGRLMETISFAKHMPAAGFQPTNAAVMAWTGASQNRSPNDHRVRFAYDAAGRTTATATAQSDANLPTAKWSVVQMHYDAYGQLEQRAARSTWLEGLEPSAKQLTSVAACEDDSVVRYQYDPVGRVSATATALGNKRWALESRDYDVAGNLIRTTKFATELVGDGETSDLRAATKSSNGDRITRYAYDGANRMVLSVDAGNTATSLRYDTRGNVIETRVHASPATVVDGKIAAANTNADRVSRTVYDLNNRAVFLIDAMLGVTQHRYDALGNLLESTAYEEALRSAPPPDARAEDIVLPASGARRRQRYIYDSTQRLLFSVDALGYLKETRYDALGRVTAELRYRDGVCLAPGLSDSALANAARACAARDKPDAVTLAFSYDAGGNLASSTDELRNSERYSYDALGRRTAFINKLDKQWNYEYDAAGRLLAERTPLVTAFNDTGLYTNPGEAGEEARLVTKMQYDALGNLRFRTEAAGIAGKERTTEYRYDTLGRQVRTIQASLAIYDESSSPASKERKEIESGAREVAVRYNALGNAVSNTDVGGRVSHKIYDRMGRVAYEIDADGYVTGYQYDAFGKVEKTTRYQEKPGSAPAGKGYGELSPAEFGKLLTPRANEDRAIITAHDLMGRVVRVSEPAGLVYDHHGTGTSTTFEASRTTATTYDALGNVKKVAVYAANDEGVPLTEAAVTYHFYNARGEKSASVQALSDLPGQRSGYLTRYQYDAAGNLTDQHEYADPYDWTALEATPKTSAFDRHLSYRYDDANRQVAEIRVGVTYADSSNPGVLVTGDLTTSFEYDKLGNRTAVTDALGGTLTSRYDVLGRVVATGKTQSTATAGIAVAGSKLTEFRLDIHGNAVLTIEHAESVANHPTAKPAIDDLDRISAARYDRWGRALETLDAVQFRKGDNKAPQQASYDVYGRVARQWQAVSNYKDEQEIAFQVLRYDAAGRVIEVTTPGNTDLVDATTAQAVRKINQYNAFGELTATKIRGSDGTDKQISAASYDQAGRQWLSNMEDGVYKVRLHDAQGRVTAEIRSTEADADYLTRVANAQAADSLRNVLRQEIRYNLAGQMVDSRQIGDKGLRQMARREGKWIEEALAGGNGAANALIRIGDSNTDADRNLSVRYRKLDSKEWLDGGSERVYRVDGTPVFSTQGLDSGDYEYQVLVKHGANEPLVRDGALLHIEASANDEATLQIIAAYLLVFNRAPERAGLNFWLDFAAKGLSLQRIVQNMLSAPEAQARFAGDGKQAIDTVFREVFNAALNADAYREQAAAWGMRYVVASATAPETRGEVLCDLMDMFLRENGTPGKVLAAKRQLVYDYLIAHQGNDSAFINSMVALAANDPAGALAQASTVGALEKRRLDVIRVYIAVLGRAPESAGIEHWVGRQLDPAQMADAMLGSEEARQPWLYPRNGSALEPELLVNRAYNLVLNRVPSASEMTAALAMLGGVPYTSPGAFVAKLVADTIGFDGVDSARVAERQLFNNKVAMAYAAGVTRTNTLSEQAGAALLSGVTNEASAQAAVDRAKAAMASAALRAPLDAAAAALAAGAAPAGETRRLLTRMYLAFLGRVPDQAGFEYQLAKAPSSDSQWLALCNSFMSTSEAGATQADFKALDNREFVQRLYTNALGQLPTGAAVQAEIQGFINQLDGGKSRAAVGWSVVSGMLDSKGLSAAELDYRKLLDNRSAVALVIAQSMDVQDDALRRTALAGVTAGDTETALDRAYTNYKRAVFDAVAVAKGYASAGAPMADATAKAAEASMAAAASLAGVKANPAALMRLQVVQLYIAILGRSTSNPPDPLGLEFNLASGAPLSTHAYNFSISKEAGETGLFNEGMSNRAFVEKLYSQILGAQASASASLNLAGSAVPPRDIAYWVSLLDGKPIEARGEIAVDILNAIMDYANWAPDAAASALITGRNNFLQKVAQVMDALEGRNKSEITRLTDEKAVLKKAMDDLKLTLPPLEAAMATAKTTRDLAINAAASAVASASGAGDARGLQRLQTVRLYAALLQRKAGSNPLTNKELDYYANDSLETIAYRMITSESDTGCIFRQTDSNETFVRKLYTAILGRQVENPVEMAGYLSLLEGQPGSSTARATVAMAIMNAMLGYSDGKTYQLENKLAFDQRVNELLAALSSDAAATASQASARLTDARNLESAAASALQLYTQRQAVSAALRAGYQDANLYKTSSLKTPILNGYAALWNTADYAGVVHQIKYAPSVDDVLEDLLVAYPSDKVEFIKQLYRSVLGRATDPTQQEIDFYLKEMPTSSAAERLTVAKYFMASAEGMGHYPALTRSLDAALTAIANAALDSYSQALANEGAARQAWETASRASAAWTVASAQAALSIATGAKESLSAILVANNKVLEADNKYIAYGKARDAHDVKSAAWKAAEKGYLDFPAAALTSLIEAQTANLLLKGVTQSMANAAALQASATAMAAGNPTANAARNVSQLVQALLNRTVTVDDLNQWMPLILSKGYSMAMVAQGIMDSAEAMSRNLYPSEMGQEAFITRLYANGLGRDIAADAGALAFWKAQFTSQRSRADMAVLIMRSANQAMNDDTKRLNERTNAALTAVANLQFTAADVDKLIRTANQHARAAFASANAAANAALNASQDGTSMMQLARIYLLILNREPDAAGLGFWMNAMRGANALTPAQVAQGFLDSVEGKRLLSPAMSGDEFVTALFTRALSRAPNSVELAKYRNMLTTRTRGEVALEICADLLDSSTDDYTASASRILLQDRIALALNRAYKALSDHAQAVRAANELANTLGPVATQDTTPIRKVNSSTTSGSRGHYGTNLYTVDRWGNVTEMRDLRDPNFKITYTYNHDNQLVRQTANVTVIDAGTPAAYTRYDALGRIVAKIDRMGGMTRQQYDANGNVVSQIDAEDGVVEQDYDLFGNRTVLRRYTTAKTGGASDKFVQTNYAYDHLGRLTSTWNAQEVDAYTVKLSGYDNDFVAQHSTTRLAESYEYDQLGRRIRTMANDGTQQIAEYDLDGNLIATATRDTYGALLYRVVTRYDAFHNRRAQRDANGMTMTWETDAFGRVHSSIDLAGRVTQNSYDAAGRKTLTTVKQTTVKVWSRDWTAGEPDPEYTPRTETTTKIGRISYAYVNGQLAEIFDDQSGMTTSYTYDKVGNRLTEKQRYAAGTPNAPVSVQNNTIFYDMENRVVHVKDPAAEVKYWYDNNGNRTIIESTFGSDIKKVFNAYDKMNRQTVVNGEWVNGQAVYGRIGHALTYDKAGNRMSDTYLGKALVYDGRNYSVKTNTKTEESYEYDTASRLVSVARDGRLMELRHYDLAGRISESGMLYDYAYRQQAAEAGIDTRKHLYSFDFGGHVTRQADIGHDGKRTDIYYEDRQKHGGAGYDKMGNLTGYTVVSTDNDNARYDITHEWFDGAREAAVVLAGHATHSSTYDVFGNRLEVRDQTGQVKTRLWYDADGHVQSKVSDGAHTTWLIANGQVLGEKGYSTDKVLGSTYVPATSGSLSAPPSAYTVQSASEDLHGIAKAIWGDANLWYLIADVNGLDAGAALKVGQVLRIPIRINTVHNDANTFKPYNAAEAVGDVAPPMPAPKQGGCGVIGTVVAIVVTAMLTYIAPMGAKLWATMAYAAIGSAAGQGAGIVAGEQKHFNWRAVGMSALSAGATYGVNSYFGATGTASGGAGAGAAGSGSVGGVATAAESSFLSGSGWQATAGRAMLSNAITQGVGNILGLQKGFSWRNVAAAGAGAAASHLLNSNLPKDGIFSNGITRDFVKDFGAGLSSAVARGGKIEIRQIATDAFGNALANSLVESMKESAANRQLIKALEKTGTPYTLDDNGHPVANLNHRASFNFVQGAAQGGASVDEIFQAKSALAKGLSQLDSAPGDLPEDVLRNRTANTLAAQVGVAEGRDLNLLSSDLASGNTSFSYLENVSGSVTGPKGASIIGNTVAGGITLMAEFADFYAQHEFAAAATYKGMQAVFSGGPVKTVVLEVAKMGVESVLSDATGAIANVAEYQTREYVTDYARKQGWQFQLTVLGQNVTAGPEQFGQAAGRMAGGVVESILGKGVDAFASRGEAISNIVQNSGRSGKQARLRELMDDDKVSSADRGWLRNEQRRIDQGEAVRLRNPRNSGNSPRGGTELAHPRGQEAAKGIGYANAYIQDADLHKLQHKYDNYGRKNPKRQ